MTKELSDSDKRILTVIREYIQKTGYSPTLWEIADTAPATYSTAKNAVPRLVKAGKLVRTGSHIIAVVGMPAPKRRPRNVLPETVAGKRNRKCLDCGSDFDSEWVGNRICSPCKHTKAWRGSNANDYSAPGLRFG